MTEVTLASLAMDFNVAKAAPAKQQTDDLRASARALEEQVKTTSQAVRDHAVSLGLSGTAAGRVEQQLRPVIAAYGQARDSLGRFAREDGDYRLSQDATAKMMLQNAKTVETYARQQEQAAKAVAAAEAVATRSREADMNATATLLIRNAKLRDDLRLKEEQAAKAVAKAEADAARSREADMNATATLLVRNAKLQADLARQQEQAAATTDSYAAKVAGLKAQLDPFSAVQLRFAQNTKLLDDAMAHGAITAGQYQEMMSKVTRAALQDVQAIDRLQRAHGGAAASAKLQTHELANLGRQGADVFVQLASGQGVMMTLIQQGPQIADVFSTAAARGVDFKSALAGIVAEAGPFLAIAAPMVIAAGVIALGTKRALDNAAAVRSFTGQLTLNADGLNYNATALVSTSKELRQYGISAADAAAGLSTFVSAGVDATRLKDFSVAAKSLSEVSPAFRDLKSAQDAVSTAFTGGFDAVQKLDKQLNFLTVDQYKHIKAQYDSGHASEAQTEAFNAFMAKVDEAADKARGPWETSVRDLSAAWSDFLDNLANTNAIQAAVAALQGLMDTARAAMNLKKDEDDKRNSAPDYMQPGVLGRIGGALGRLGPITLGAPLIAIDELGRAKKREDYMDQAIRGVGDLGARGAGKSDADDRAAKAYEDVIGELTLRRDQTKKINDAERVELVVAKAKADATSRGVADERLAEIGKIAAETEQAKIAQEKASQARSALAADNRALRVNDATADALDRVQKAELTARQGLTQNIELLAGFRRTQVEQEADAARENVDREVKAKKLDEALAPAIKAAITRTEALKKQAIDQQLAGQLIDEEVRQRGEMAAFSDRTLQAQMGMATSLEQAQAIEGQALAARQAREWADAKAQERKERLDGTFNAEATKARNTERMIAQTGERELKARNDRLAVFQRDLQLAQQGYQNELDLLGSRKGLAQSAHEAAQFDRQIAGVRYQAERDVLAKTTIENGYKQDAVDAARARIPVLDELYRNELRALDLSDNMVTAYSDLVQALAGAARSVIDGDIGGSISAAGGVLRQLSGLTGSAGLATAASYAGPIGVAVSAVTGVLGAIGAASAEKAQRKLDALNTAVEGLRADNKSSSGSIAAALGQANANWNSDLEYSSAMVSSLRSIDDQIGRVANSLARSISGGGLLDTSRLGLGSTVSKGQLSFLGLLGGLSSKKTTTELSDQGLQFNPTTFGALANGGLSGSTYADLVSTTVKKFLGQAYSTKVSTSTVTGAIGGDLTSQLTAVIKALGDGVLSAAAVFGAEAAKSAAAALGSAVVDLGKLSLKDMKSDEIAEVLNATLDKVADQLAAAGVPGLEQLADVGEGAFETLTRLAREYQVVDVALASLGKTFGAVGLASIAARDDLVKLFGGLDAFTSATSFFAQNFLSDAEQLAPVIKAVNDNLRQYGLSAESSRDQFKALVLAQNLTTEAGRATYAALLAVAPAFDKVATAADASAKTISDAAAQMVTDAQSRVNDARSLLQDAYDAEKTRLHGIVDAASGAESALRSAYDAQASGIQSTIEKLTSFSQSIREFSRSLTLDGASGASAAQRAGLAGAEFDRVLAAAMAGDDTARGQYQSVAQDLLKAQADASSTALGYQAAVAKVQDANEKLGKTADTQATLAQQQLAQLKTQVGALIDLGSDVKSVETAISDLLTARGAAAIAADQIKALDQQVAGLLTVNTSVLSVKDAVLGLNGAIKALADAQAVKNAGLGWTSPNGGVAVPTNPNYGNPYGNNGAFSGEIEKLMGKNAAGQATFAGFTAAELAWVSSPLELGGERTAAAQAIQQLKAMYGPNVLPGFAKGGSFMVGGFGGIDQNLLSINGAPAAMVGQGEIITVTPPGAGPANDNSWREVLAELRSLRAEVSSLRQDTRIGDVATVKAINRQTETIEKWDEEGLAVHEA